MLRCVPYIIYAGKTAENAAFICEQSALSVILSQYFLAMLTTAVFTLRLNGRTHYDGLLAALRNVQGVTNAEER